MKKVQYFRAACKTRRFRKNQKVWLRFNHANHLTVFFRFRGSGRYVEGVADKFAGFVGEIKTIEVEDNFADRVHGRYGDHIERTRRAECESLP